MADRPLTAQWVLTAQWALWGKRASDTQYHVLACSVGTLTERDFAGIIDRYASGTADRLPQYTVGWVPGAEGSPEFIALAIHEHAPYGAQSADRSRYDALGREVVFVRLFCVRYTDLAEHETSYAELLDAVEQQQLPLDSTAPATIRVRPHQQQEPAAGLSPGTGLAEEVATLLLTAAQVCVLGADEVPAADRLAFIDLAMSLLPYGLRARLSASTWASSTAQGLKLRLFFASAPRDDDGRTRHVRWAQPAVQFPDSDSEAARLYWNWLRRTGPQARSLLTGQTAPLRFTDADIRQMVATLPRDLTLADTLEDLAASLGDGDATAVAAKVRRLERYLAVPLEPEERDHYRRHVLDQGLLKNHPVRHATKARMYRMLLSLAYEAPLSYASYCEIEDAAGGPPHGTLRSEMLKLKFSSFLPWLLAAKAAPGITDTALMDTMDENGVPVTATLRMLQRDTGNLRPAHRPVLYDFAVRYLRAYAEDPATELARCGFLADTLEAVFPGDLRAQQTRLEDTLRFVYGEQLSRGQIRELFADPVLRPTEAFEAAVTQLVPSSSSKTREFVEQQAAYARLRYARDGDEPRAARRTRRAPRRNR